MIFDILLDSAMNEDWTFWIARYWFWKRTDARSLPRAPAVPKRPVNSQAHPFRTDLKNPKYVKKWISFY